jgi:hypothetical protein
MAPTEINLLYLHLRWPGGSRIVQKLAQPQYALFYDNTIITLAFDLAHKFYT